MKYLRAIKKKKIIIIIIIIINHSRWLTWPFVSPWTWSNC